MTPTGHFIDWFDADHNLIGSTVITPLDAVAIAALERPRGVAFWRSRIEAPPTVGEES